MGCESPAPAPTYLIKCCTGAGEPWANNKGVVYVCCEDILRHKSAAGERK